MITRLLQALWRRPRPCDLVSQFGGHGTVVYFCRTHQQGFISGPCPGAHR